MKVENYIQKTKGEPFVVKKFVYDLEKYKSEQESKTKIKKKMELLKVISFT